MRGLRACIVALIVLIPCFLSKASGPALTSHIEANEDILDRVTAAWKARADLARTAIVEWTEEELVPAGSFSAMMPPKTPGEVNPPVDARHKSNYKMTLDDTKSRIDSTTFIWSNPDRRFEPMTISVAQDGILETTFRTATNGTELRGVITKEKSNSGTTIASWPIMATFRGCDRNFMNRDDLSEYIKPATAIDDPARLTLISPRDETRGERRIGCGSTETFPPPPSPSLRSQRKTLQPMSSEYQHTAHIGNYYSSKMDRGSLC